MDLTDNVAVVMGNYRARGAHAEVPLAMFGDRSFAASRTTCAPGDLFVILTDGLTEVFDRRDREFGIDRVKALVRAHAIESLRDLQDTLLAAVRAHGPQLDDQTLLLIRVLDTTTSA